MQKVISFLKQLNLQRIIAVFVTGLAVVLMTACSANDVRNAKVDNLPVQVGGQNNPYKAGGDSYTNYKMSTDARVREGHPVTERDPNTDPRVNRGYSQKQSEQIQKNLSSGMHRSYAVPRSERTASERKASQRKVSMTNDPTNGKLIASSVVEPDAADIQYQSSRERQLSDRPRTSGENTPPQAIPAPRQKVINRNDPGEKILENIGEQFKDASEFIRDGVDSAAGQAFKDDRIQNRDLKGQNSIVREGY